MTHRAAQIVDAMVARLQAFASLGVNPENVFAHRTLSLTGKRDELPAVTVNFGDDNPANEYDEMSGEIGSVLDVLTKALFTADDEPTLKRALLAIRTEAHKAIDLTSTLDLPFVLKVEYGGAAAPEFDFSGEVPAGSQESRWLVTYHMRPSDPS